MRTFSAPPQIEVIGRMVSLWTDNLESHQTRPIFEKHGLANLDPMGWYPLNSFMQALNELVAQGDATAGFTAIGMALGDLIPLPLNLTIDDFEGGIVGLMTTYNGDHRNHKHDIGDMWAERVGPRHYKISNDLLYPDDFNYGLLYNIAKRLLPPGTVFSLSYDPDLPQRDQDNAGVTVMHLEWEG